MMADDGTVARGELIQGLLFSHTRINLNTIETHKALAKTEALLEILVEAGLLDPEEFERKRAEAEDRLRTAFVEQGMSVAIQEHDSGKYEPRELPEIDCENRVHLCHAACCRLQFALSKEDVEEGIVRWDLGRPYFIAHRADGSCVHLRPEDRRCDVYAHRPVPCRVYDCSRDKRVWEDFEKRIPNPRVGDPSWPACLRDEGGEAMEPGAPTPVPLEPPSEEADGG
jgi:Fe-S-cluster containining protein